MVPPLIKMITKYRREAWVYRCLATFRRKK